ncbi:FliH/SctL family protein [Candidatus Magnetobacterium casense]|uniref:FliH/SctL family protein n=1 Tax=Candidatus Magnetobacterium casense TaxID=1455061 RepID=UPI00058C552F|nr:FliH/SctL family protein [Candidatus Magnetobacterium casensis]
MYRGRLIKGMEIAPYKMPTLEPNSRKPVKRNPFDSALPESVPPSSSAPAIDVNNNGDETHAEKVPDIAQIKRDIEHMHQEAIQKATAEAARIKQDAYQKGLEEGEKTGMKNAHDKTISMLEQIAKVIEEVKTFRTRSIDGLQPQVVELAISIARKIIGEEFSAKPEIIVSVVREALTRIDKAGHVTIKVNPAVYDLFMQHKDSLIDIYPDVGIEVDPMASQRGPIVVGTTEEIITDIEELLNNAVEDMRDNVVLH